MGLIVVIGSSNTDMVVQTPHLPGRGETVLGGTFFQAPGGKGANQAVAAARAGGSVTFIACVGKDDLGDRALAGFRAEGIDTGHVVQIADTPSGIALIVVDDAGENSIAVASGANARLLPAAVEAASNSLDEADVVLLQLESPLETVRAAVEKAARSGKMVILNPAPAQELPDTVWQCVTVLTPNQTEAEFLSGVRLNEKSDAAKVSRILLDKGVDRALISKFAQRHQQFAGGADRTADNHFVRHAIGHLDVLGSGAAIVPRLGVVFI